MNQSVDIIQFNCSGLNGHKNEIIELINKYKPKFVLLQELKISFDQKVKIKGYSLITSLKAGQDSKTTSVGILIRDKIIYTRTTTPDGLCV